jgi:hypothetical protein
MLGRRARAAEHTIHEVHADRPHLLNYVRVEIAVVRASYWFFVAGWLLLIAGAAGPVIRALGRVASSSASTAALTERDLLFELLGLMMFVVAEALARWSRRRMSDVFSAFWRSHQRDLRDALERALSDERNRSR